MALVVQPRPCHRGYADRTAAVALSTNRRKKLSDWIGRNAPPGCFVCRSSCRCDLSARLVGSAAMRSWRSKASRSRRATRPTCKLSWPYCSHLVYSLTVLPFATVSSAVGVSAEQHCSTAPEPLLLSSSHRIPHASQFDCAFEARSVVLCTSARDSARTCAATISGTDHASRDTE